MEMHLASVWEAVADVVGDEVALAHGDRRLTRREFEGRAGRLAGVLVELHDAVTVGTDDLVAAVRGQLAGYKAPRHGVAGTPPRGSNGKAGLALTGRILEQHARAEHQADRVPAT